MVRECTHSAGKNRGEESRSWYIMLRSVFNTKINEIVFAAIEDKVFRGNKHMGPGKERKREVRSDEAKKKHGGDVEKSDRTKKQHVQGARRVVIALDFIRSHFVEAQGFATAEEHKQIKKEHFMSDESKSIIKRVGEKL